LYSSPLRSAPVLVLHHEFPVPFSCTLWPSVVVYHVSSPRYDTKACINALIVTNKVFLVTSVVEQNADVQTRAFIALSESLMCSKGSSYELIHSNLPLPQHDFCKMKHAGARLSRQSTCTRTDEPSFLSFSLRSFQLCAHID